MSNEAIHWAWKQTTGNPTTKLILHVLADLADEAHSCWPTVEHIAAKTETSDSTVKRHLRDLESAGFIRRERRYSGFGRRSTGRFVLAVDREKFDNSSLEANLTPNEAPEEKPLVTALEANLTPNEKNSSPLGANCDPHIKTPHEIDNKLSIRREEPAVQAEVATLPDYEISEVDKELKKIHASLSVAAIGQKLKTVQVDEIDVLFASKMILERAKGDVFQPASYIASAIDKAPDAWRTSSSPFRAGTVNQKEVSSREIEAKEKSQCLAGNHDWGQNWWTESDRRYCVRPLCGVSRASVEPEYAALSDRMGW